MMSQKTEILKTPSRTKPLAGKTELIIDQGPDSGQRTLISTLTIIGTDPACSIKLTDPCVSGRHCSLHFKNGKLLLKDLDSTNGTLLGGRKIREIHLNSYESVKIGSSVFSLAPVQDNSETETCDMLSSRSPHMKELFRQIKSVADNIETVLIEGESGTGKELVAHALHNLSSRRESPFIPINCGALAADIIESELFGHKRGAFTGAERRREGAFVAAKNGTLFLDEIGELPFELQPKLLRALENREVKPVGADISEPVNARVVAATNRGLKNAVATGKFREDLYFRLNLIPLKIPPLRDRIEDIVPLIEHFLGELSGAAAPEAKQLLIEYDWPGNVRELKHLLTRAHYLSKHKRIEIDDLFLPVRTQTLKDRVFTDAGEVPPLNELEKHAISTVLKQTDYNKTRTAKMLKVSKSTLLNKMRRYKLTDVQ